MLKTLSLFKQFLNKTTTISSKSFSYFSRPAHYALINKTIGQTLEVAADLYADEEAFVFCQTGDRLKFKDLKKNSEKIAQGLLEIGLKRGDRLGLWAPNCIEWILTQYATALIGVIQVNINPAYKANELEYSLNKVGCKALIMSERFKNTNCIETLFEICPELHHCKSGRVDTKRLKMLKNIVLIGDKPHENFFKFNDLYQLTNSTQAKIIQKNYNELQASDPINIQYTSGTTGYPKGVTLSHHMILNNVIQINRNLDYDKRRPTICLPVPLYHCFGMVLGSLSTITNGAKSVFPSKEYNPEMNLKAIVAEKCTSYYGTPTMFIDLLDHLNLKDYDLSSLKTGLMSGSTCPQEVVEAAADKLGIKDIVVIYGMTETSPVITMSSVNDTFENRTQTIGRPMEHLECKVVDENNRVVAYNQPGQLLTRGYSTLIEYWNDKEKTEETYTHDRFLKTGDLVCMNENGYMKHLGRLKDMIIRGGENIYPKEIEELLHKNDKIADVKYEYLLSASLKMIPLQKVYVIGVPDKRLGEELCACVKIASGRTLTEQEVKDYCKHKISDFKIPRYVKFMNEFPMTVTGKIQKNKLRELIIERKEF